MTEPLNAFGLRERDMRFIARSLRAVPGLERAVLFGSRARGTHRLASDVDLAVWGRQVRHADLLRLRFVLNEEAPALLHFDVVHYNAQLSVALRAEIDRWGQPFPIPD